MVLLLAPCYIVLGFVEAQFEIGDEIFVEKIDFLDLVMDIILKRMTIASLKLQIMIIQVQQDWNSKL